MLQKLQAKYIFPVTLFVFIACFIVGYIGRGQGFSSYNSTIFTIASFIYGIFISFAISNSSNNLSKINELLRTYDANLLIVYKLVEEFDASKLSKCRDLIDRHLIDQIDYKLADFDKSSSSFLDLYDFVVKLEPKTSKQSTLYSEAIKILDITAQGRKQTEALTQQSVSIYEWFSIIMLLVIVIFYILSINQGKLFDVVISSLLIVPMIVLTLVLQTLNNLRWDEDTQIWEPLQNLFYNLKLLPYFPDEVIRLGRYKPEGKGKVRIAHYAEKYPNMTGKHIETVSIDELS